MTEEDFLKKRYKELANNAYNRNCFTFTDFLSQGDVDLLLQIEKELAFIPYKFYGGREFCDRVIARFGDSELFGYEEEFPISCICVKASAAKFAGELTHRDFLGAVLNLGIERSVIGDILVADKKNGVMGYIFCLDKFADYIVSNLDRIKHTSVKCSVCNEVPEELGNRLEEKELLVVSERLDVVISAVYNFSRSQCVELIRERKIYVNSRLNENVSYNLKKDDVVSVRGKGKFIYSGLEGETKKGKLRVLVKQFV